MAKSTERVLAWMKCFKMLMVAMKLRLMDGQWKMKTKRGRSQMSNGSHLLQPVKCQWNPRDALINLFTRNLHSPPAPLKAVTQHWWFSLTNWSALHKHGISVGTIFPNTRWWKTFVPVSQFHILHRSCDRAWNKAFYWTLFNRFCMKCIYWLIWV